MGIQTDLVTMVLDVSQLLNVWIRGFSVISCLCWLLLMTTQPRMMNSMTFDFFTESRLSVIVPVLTFKKK